MRVVAALIAAIAVAVGVFIAVGGAMAGFAWIYMFGDNTWPDWAPLVIFVPAVGCSLISAFLVFRTILQPRSSG